MNKFLLVFAALIYAGCTPVVPAESGIPPVAAVVVSPASAELEVTGELQFTTSESGNWSVQEAGGGFITSTGYYTAPATPGTYHVVSTTSDNRSGKSVVKVRKTTMTVNPTTGSVSALGTIQFTALVTGPTDTSVSWSVQETAGGSITASGLYSAPATPGTYHVVARSNGNIAKSVTIPVTVGQAMTIAISPATATANACPGTTVQFGTIFTGTSDTRVVWAVQEPGFGSVSAGGLYTVPTVAGTYHVQATSLADISKMAVATITVNPDRVLSVTVSPPNVTVPASGSAQFTATVTTVCAGPVVSAMSASMGENGQPLIEKL